MLKKFTELVKKIFSNFKSQLVKAKANIKLSNDQYFLILFSFIAATLLVLVSLAAGFVLGNLWTRVSLLEKGGSVNAGTGNNNLPTGQPTQPAAAVDVPKPTKKDHIRGSSNAQVALITYSDFDCPFCVQFHATTVEALKYYGDKLMFVYRHFPLTQLHPEAFKKAVASECVFEQGGEAGFWAYTDKIFGDDTERIGDLERIVGELGFDGAKFTECLNADKYAQKVTDQQAEGTKSGVQGTPGNYLVNLKTGKTVALRGAVPLDALKLEIDRLLQ